MRATMMLILAALVATPLPAQTVAITGGRVLPVSGPAIDDGTVLIRDGKIVAVGANVSIPADARRIDATGQWVTPGLVNAATSIGLQEVGAVPTTVETQPVAQREQRGVSASYRVWDGFNPASVLIPAAAKGGITTAVILPSGGLVAGQGAVMHLAPGNSLRDMIVRAPAAMVARLGSSQLGTRAEQIARLRELLDDARAYARNRAAFERGDTREFAATRADLEALQPVLAGTLPLLLAVDQASDIQAALGLARDYGIRLIIGGGADAWMVADEIARARVPVLTGAMNNIPGFGSLGQRQETAALLRRAGVPVAIIGNAGGGDEEAFNVRNLRFEAGNAVAYGMTWDDALRAVTLTPAEIFGVADRVGSLQPGRDADVVVWSGDPFEFASQPVRVFLRGVEHTQASRQDMLQERYRNLPPNYDSP